MKKKNSRKSRFEQKQKTQRTQKTENRPMTIDIHEEYRKASAIFALMGEGPATCPTSGTDEDKLISLLWEHAERGAALPVERAFRDSTFADDLKIYTQKMAEHTNQIKQLIGVLRSQ